MYSDSERGGEPHVARDMSSLHDGSTQTPERAAAVNPPAYIIPVVVVLVMLLYVLGVYIRCYFVSKRRTSRHESFSIEEDVNYYRLPLPPRTEKEKAQATQNEKQPVVSAPSQGSHTRARRQIIDATQQETRRID